MDSSRTGAAQTEAAKTVTGPNAIDELVRQVPYFGGLDPNAQTELAHAAVPSNYAAGEVIFLEGEPAKGLLLVESGLVKLVRVSSEGRQHIIHILEPGDPFNEVSVLDGGPNPATAVAQTDCRLWCICRTELVVLGEAYPELVWALAGCVAEHARFLLGAVLDLAVRTVKARLARLLLEEAQALDSSELPRYLTQEEMAGRLGTVREVVGRALRSLSAEGVIAVERHTIVILDPAKLAEAAKA